MKDIKDYLHLYLGCECVIGDLSWKREEYTYGLRPDVDLDYGKPIRSKLDAHVLNAFAQETTLILRPLSDMTKEEKLEAFQHLYGEDQFNALRLDFKIQTNNLNSDAFRYLLSKGFDLYGLIEAGLAIDKTERN